MRHLVPLAAAAVAALAFTGCHTQPTVSASPSTNLVDGQEVKVTGGGYGPGATVGVIQCPAGADSLDDCDSDTAHTPGADDQGHFSTTVAVKRTVNDGHNVTTDCGAAPGACEIVSVNVHGFANKATAPLSFAP